MKIWSLKVILVCALCLPTPSLSAQSVDTTERGRLLLQIEQLLQQIAGLEALLQAQQSEVTLTDGKFTESVSVQAKYTRIPGASWSIQNPEHRVYVEVIESLWPQRYSNRLLQFVVFDESRELFDAYVETTDLERNLWTFGVGDELVSVPLSDASQELIMHELAHVFANDNLPTNLTAFIDRFWSTGQLADAARMSRAINPEEAAYRYFLANPGEFVNDYAASSPDEDFAESFMYYTRGMSPDCINCVAHQKIQFFAQQ